MARLTATVTLIESNIYITGSSDRNTLKHIIFVTEGNYQDLIFKSFALIMNLTNSDSILF